MRAGVDPHLSVVERYDPVAATWATQASLPNARSGIAVVALGRHLLALGGEGNPANPAGTFADNDLYDPARDSWVLLSTLPLPVHGIGAAVINGRVHVPGGGPVEGFGVTDEHQRYDPLQDPAFPVAVPSLTLGAALLLATLLALVAASLRRR